MEIKNGNRHNTKSMMKDHYSYGKLDKSNELNSKMTIQSQAKDEYTAKTQNVKGGN